MNGFLRKKISKLQIESMAKCFVLPRVCTYLLLVIIRDEKSEFDVFCCFINGIFMFLG